MTTQLPKANQYNIIASIGSMAMDAPDTPYIPPHTNGMVSLEIVPKKLNYIFTPDSMTLSFSRLQTLRTCPRMFLCKELVGSGSYKPSIDTAYGHAFAAGVQELLTSGNLSRAFLAAIEAWDYQYFTDPWGKKHNKSFWYAIASIHQWYYSVYLGLADDYEVATLGGRPAIELFVYLQVGAGYNYQIHIDVVLRSKVSGNLVVCEIKTSGMPQQRANWENSLQTLGYYTEIAAIAAKCGEQVEPEIMYIVQQVGKLGDVDANHGFFTFIFAKDRNATAEFMMDLATQTATLETYTGYGYFPKYGHNCVQFGRPCQFFGTCDSIAQMPRSSNTSTSQHYEENDLTSADYVLTFESIVQLLGDSSDASTTDN